MFAIAIFTHELQPQGKKTENFYFQLKFTDNLNHFGGYFYFLQMAMSHFEDQKMKVYRGFPLSNLEGVEKIYSKSQQISISNFISSTSDISLAQKAAGKGGIIMEIDVLTGKNISEYAFLKNKSEVVLCPNMVFFVSEELHKEDDGYFHLKLTQTALCPISSSTQTSLFLITDKKDQQRCKNCNKRGHLSKDCTAPKRTQTRISSSTLSSNTSTTGPSEGKRSNPKRKYSKHPSKRPIKKGEKDHRCKN